jgi:hydrogenase maturation factor
MAAKKFLRLIAGVMTEAFGVQSSAGAGNAGDIVSLDDTGRIDATMMPVGIGADVKIIQASEALAAGDFVNVHDASGARVRKMDATTAGKTADGFVLAAVSSGSNATVHFEGTNNQVTGQTPGPVYMQTTAGVAGATVPSAAGNVVQQVGVAVSATEINFERGVPVTLA